MSRGWQNLRGWRCRLAPLMKEMGQLQVLGRARVLRDPPETEECLLEESELKSYLNQNDLNPLLEQLTKILIDVRARRLGGPPAA